MKTASLIIGGREYVQSSDAARIFGYTPDYISRLAREKKVVAAQINKKWFVEKESLNEFIRQKKVEKIQRTVQLQKQRKIEHQSYRKKEIKHREQDRAQIVSTLLQSFVVVLCGLIVGTVGWFTYEQDITSTRLVSGFQQTSSDIASVIIAGFSFFDENLSEEDCQNCKVGTFNRQKSEADKEGVDQEYNYLFSDTVRVLESPDGKRYIRPLYRDEKEGALYYIED